MLTRPNFLLRGDAIFSYGGCSSWSGSPWACQTPVGRISYFHFWCSFKGEICLQIQSLEAKLFPSTDVFLTSSSRAGVWVIVPSGNQSAMCSVFSVSAVAPAVLLCLSVRLLPPPCNEAFLSGSWRQTQRYLTNPKPRGSSGNFSFFFLWKECPFRVWMSQVNPIPKGNGISDGEQIAPRWCRTGQETLEEKKKSAHSGTMEDAAVIFAVSRVFIIDFSLWHNGRPIMKSLSFRSLCAARWWGHRLKVAQAARRLVKGFNLHPETWTSCRFTPQA